MKLQVPADVDDFLLFRGKKILETSFALLVAGLADISEKKVITADQWVLKTGLDGVKNDIEITEMR